MAALSNGSFVSPLANLDHVAAMPITDSSFLFHVYSGINAWSAVLTVLLMLVAYDQCE